MQSAYSESARKANKHPEHLCAVGRQQCPRSRDSLGKRRVLITTNPSLTQGKVTWLLQEAASQCSCNPRACVLQPPQRELTDFNDYVITENFTTNTKIPSGGHIEDRDVHSSVGGKHRAHKGKSKEIY